jgi:hypothetical protein
LEKVLDPITKQKLTGEHLTGAALGACGGSSSSRGLGGGAELAVPVGEHLVEAGGAHDVDWEELGREP